MNKERLKEAGILYPETGLLHIGHHRLVNTLDDKRPVGWIPTEEGRPLNRRLKLELQEFDGDAIISSEAFFSRNPHDFAKSFRGFELSFIAFVRQQYSLADSWTRQKLRAVEYEGTVTQTFETFMKYHDYTRVFRNWIRRYGDGRLKVVPMTAANVIGVKLEQLFFQTIGHSIPEDCIFPGKENQKLNRDCITFGRGVDKAKPTEKNARLWQMLGEYSKQHPEDIKYRSIYSPSRLKEIHQHFKDTNTVFARQVMSPEHAEIFLNGDGPKDFEWEEWPGLTLEAAFEIMRYLLDQN